MGIKQGDAQDVTRLGWGTDTRTTKVFERNTGMCGLIKSGWTLRVKCVWTFRADCFIRRCISRTLPADLLATKGGQCTNYSLEMPFFRKGINRGQRRKYQAVMMTKLRNNQQWRYNVKDWEQSRIHVRITLYFPPRKQPHELFWKECRNVTW